MIGLDTVAITCSAACALGGCLRQLPVHSVCLGWVLAFLIITTATRLMPVWPEGWVWERGWLLWLLPKMVLTSSFFASRAAAKCLLWSNLSHASHGYYLIALSAFLATGAVGLWAFYWGKATSSAPAGGLAVFASFFVAYAGMTPWFIRKKPTPPAPDYWGFLAWGSLILYPGLRYFSRI